MPSPYLGRRLPLHSEEGPRSYQAISEVEGNPLMRFPTASVSQRLLLPSRLGSRQNGWLQHPPRPSRCYRYCSSHFTKRLTYSHCASVRSAMLFISFNLVLKVSVFTRNIWGWVLIQTRRRPCDYTFHSCASRALRPGTALIGFPSAIILPFRTSSLLEPLAVPPACRVCTVLALFASQG
jgi:hypothetical protein